MLYINKDLILNEGIKSREIRLSGEDSRIIKTEEALKLARESDLDLVMVSPNAKPPVCKIMDYSKYIYEQSKKLKLTKKSQKIVVLKEVRLSPTIEEHDIDIKANNAKKFLSNGDKVKVSIRFRGRQNNNTQMGNKVLDIFITKIGDLGVIEKAPQLEGRNMFMIVGPKKQA
ncbi:translation initiation factor IF-3 [Clostridium pasteurianum]|uniref:Translation initiation factor IF-3 n=1 Tax=Clostridium pasteurianum BC1 TaxID=86416 RepID=R4K867_CLOPA|nr:translation initiation factor IF-3 [Clostridium pasteurianum]AGK99372.1 translation initiation factor IF-3 [Clostridium pasteurianum BC1]